MYDIRNIWHHLDYTVKLLSNPFQRKHTLRWIKSLKKDYLFDTPCLWLVFDAIDYIEPYVLEGVNVFEYGSGGSTLYWLKKGANVVTIEHDPNWSKFMKEKIRSNQPIDFRLIRSEQIANNQDYDPSDPDNYQSYWIKNMTFFEYVSQIDSFPDNYFDIISIDGRARPSCIKHSVSKVKVGGHIILDNSERDYYFLKLGNYFKDFDKFEFFGSGPGNAVEWKTNIYKRII